MEIHSDLDVAGDISTGGYPLADLDYCYLQANAAQTGVNNGVWHSVQFNSGVTHGNPAWWSATYPHEVIVPTTGIYRIETYFNMNTASSSLTDHVTGLRVDGSIDHHMMRGQAYHQMPSNSAVARRLVAGTRVGISVFHNRPGTYNIEAFRYMLVEKIGPA